MAMMGAGEWCLAGRAVSSQAACRRREVRVHRRWPWLKTGELAEVLPEGGLRISGRKAQMLDDNAAGMREGSSSPLASEGNLISFTRLQTGAKAPALAPASPEL